MENSSTTREVSGSEKRWTVLFWTFVAYFYDSLDLAILAICMPVIIKTMNITMPEAGLLASATMIGAALGSIFFGWIADNKGRRFSAVLGLICFGLFTAIVYYVETWGTFMMTRFVAGLGIGGIWGPCAALVAEHWSARYRARAESFMLSTFALGSLFAALMGTFMLSKYDWRWIFVVGGTAVIAAVFFHIYVPESKRFVAANNAGQQAKEKVRLSDLFSSENRRLTILATLASACQMGGYWGVNSWIPTFLVKERGLSLSYMGMWNIMIFSGAFIGYHVYAYIADKLGRKKALMIAFTADAVIVPMYVLIPSAEVLFWLGPVMGLSFGGVFGLFGSFFTELFPERIRALSGGFCFNMGRLGAVIAPYTVGVLATKLGLSMGIVLAAAIFALGVVVMTFLPETLGKAEHAAHVSAEKTASEA